jgi:hypothetical protein
LDRSRASLRQSWATRDGRVTITTGGLPYEAAVLEVATPDFVAQSIDRAMAVFVD